MFENELFNNETVSKFIESSFNGNVLHLGPLDEERAEQRWKTIQFVEGICNNKPRIMRKLHRVSYDKMFGSSFKTT